MADTSKPARPIEYEDLPGDMVEAHVTDGVHHVAKKFHRSFVENVNASDFAEHMDMLLDRYIEKNY